MSRSLNRACLIGNLTRDAELKFTPNNNAVCSFTVATNRSWTTDNGEKKEEVEFHRIVTWNKLAELCGASLRKGSKVYVEGRLAMRSYKDRNEQEKQVVEIIADDVVFLDKKPAEGQV